MTLKHKQFYYATVMAFNGALHEQNVTASSNGGL